MTFRIQLFCSLCLLLSGCQTAPLPTASSPSLPVRFLLTFDDGPNVSLENNTTLRILHHLDANDVQPGVKALFFVQTRNSDGGGNPIGRQLLHMMYEQGHALGLHSGTERGHIRHTLMSTPELSQALHQGRIDLQTIAGEDALLVRPTFWGYDDRTVALYAANHYRMLLTDVNTRDGIWLHSLVGMRNRIHKSLEQLRLAIQREELPDYQGAIPLVVTFHDLNTITSLSIGSYMRMLTEEAVAVGLRVADKPFYDSRVDVLAVATLRAETPETLARLAQQKHRARQAPATPTTTAALAPITAHD